jgi:hypothetical protein
MSWTRTWIRGVMAVQEATGAEVTTAGVGAGPVLTVEVGAAVAVEATMAETDKGLEAPATEAGEARGPVVGVEVGVLDKFTAMTKNKIFVILHKTIPPALVVHNTSMRSPIAIT